MDEASGEVSLKCGGISNPFGLNVLCAHNSDVCLVLTSLFYVGGCRIVGFDARMHHVIENNSTNTSPADSTRWKYGFVEKSNEYSITLPSKAAFIHREYLDIYTKALPRSIYRYVADNFQCEDIAMSYLVSSVTLGKPPLIADYWAVNSFTTIYSRENISWKHGHLNQRDGCVTDFAELLGLKEGPKAKESGLELYPLQPGKMLHNANSFFGYGSEPEDWMSVDPLSLSCPRLQLLVKELQRLQ